MNLWPIEHLQYTGTPNWGKKCSIGGRFIRKEETSYKIHILDLYLKIHLMKMSTRISPSTTQITYHVLLRHSKYCRISKIPPRVKNIFECSRTHSTFCFLWVCTNPWPGMSLSNISNTLDSQCDGDRAYSASKIKGKSFAAAVQYGS